MLNKYKVETLLEAIVLPFSFNIFYTSILQKLNRIE